MNDLISRRDAIDRKIPIQLSNGVEIYYGEAVPVEYLKHLPSADVVEVVRCKDCIHNHEHETSFGSKFHICNLNNLAFTQYADFYCAYGERREDGEIH